MQQEAPLLHYLTCLLLQVQPGIRAKRSFKKKRKSANAVYRKVGEKKERIESMVEDSDRPVLPLIWVRESNPTRAAADERAVQRDQAS